MDRKQLKSVSVVEALATALKEAIFRTEYQPGQQITEIELTSNYGVSRNTVREATAQLINSGLLEKEANKGVYVKAITESDVREIFHFRAMLECEAARMILRRGIISDALVRAMERIEMDPYLRDDWYRYVSTDLEFHAELVRAAGSPRLVRLYDSISSEIMLCLCQSRRTLIDNPRNIYEHRRFIDALKSGDETACVELVTNHIIFGVENVAKGFHRNDHAESDPDRK